MNVYLRKQFDLLSSWLNYFTKILQSNRFSSYPRDIQSNKHANFTKKLYYSNVYTEIQFWFHRDLELKTTNEM